MNEKARYTTQPPCDVRDGIAPVEQTHPCLYTQVKPCKEIYPENRDRWCGYCLGTHEAVELAPSEHDEFNPISRNPR